MRCVKDKEQIFRMANNVMPPSSGAEEFVVRNYCLNPTKMDTQPLGTSPEGTSVSGTTATPATSCWRSKESRAATPATQSHFVVPIWCRRWGNWPLAWIRRPATATAWGSRSPTAQWSCGDFRGDSARRPTSACCSSHRPARSTA